MQIIMIIIVFLKFMNARGIRLKIGIKEIKNRTFKSAVIFNSVCMEEIILRQPLQKLL